MQIRQVSAELQAKAASELNEDPARIEEYLDHLKQWIQKQPHLVTKKDDHFLLSFLRGCKFSLQRTKEKIDYYYSVRVIIPEYFSDRNPFLPEIQLILNSGVILPLTEAVSPDGSRIIFWRWCVSDPNTMPFTKLIKVLYMIIDILLEEDDNTVISGIHFIADYRSFPVGYMMQFTPPAIQKCMLGMQSAYPLRLKGMDLINIPSFFNKIFALFKPALSKKFTDRTSTYTEDDISNLYNRIPQRILPKDLGGAGKSLDELRDIWKQKIESYSKWFEEDSKYSCNEELRPKDSKSEEFGAIGTFRKLNLD